MDQYAEIAGIQIGDDHPTRIMGVINVSPESFFKGSVFASTEELKHAARQMVADGADILDVGARGTAPYLETNISAEEETKRLTHAITVIREVTDVPISADTQIADVAAAALTAGASILNDISGLAHDAAMGAIAKQYSGVILMANANYCDVSGNPTSVVTAALAAALERAQQAGIKTEKIVLDPGIGFFRDRQLSWDEWDREILRQLPAFRQLGRPLLIGVSRKSFIGKVLDHKDPADRLYGSLSVTALAVSNGACLVRTHDVAATRDATRMADWLKHSHPENTTSS